MNKKDLKNVVMSKIGLSSTEFDDLCNKIEQSTGIEVDEAISNIPNKLGPLDTDTIISMVAPNISKEDISPTKYDEQIANYLNVEPETIARLTYFAEATEVADTIYWLATQSPEYINGTCIDINNGAFLR